MKKETIKFITYKNYKPEFIIKKLKSGYFVYELNEKGKYVRLMDK